MQDAAEAEQIMKSCSPEVLLCLHLDFDHLYLLLLLLDFSSTFAPGEGPADILLPGVIPEC